MLQLLNTRHALSFNRPMDYVNPLDVTVAHVSEIKQNSKTVKCMGFVWVGGIHLMWKSKSRNTTLKSLTMTSNSLWL